MEFESVCIEKRSLNISLKWSKRNFAKLIALASVASNYLFTFYFYTMRVLTWRETDLECTLTRNILRCTIS